MMRLQSPSIRRTGRCQSTNNSEDPIIVTRSQPSCRYTGRAGAGGSRHQPLCKSGMLAFVPGSPRLPFPPSFSQDAFPSALLLPVLRPALSYLNSCIQCQRYLTTMGVGLYLSSFQESLCLSRHNQHFTIVFLSVLYPGCRFPPPTLFFNPQIKFITSDSFRSSDRPWILFLMRGRMP